MSLHHYRGILYSYMPSPFITITLPVYGEAVGFIDCLNSLSQQTFTDCEYIIVDDSDKNCKTAKHLYDGFINVLPKELRKQFRYISHHKNKGLIEARRTGISHARGMYTLTIDSDDFFDTPEALQILHDAVMVNNTDVIQFAARLTGELDTFPEKLVTGKGKAIALTQYFENPQHDVPLLHHVFLLKDLPTFGWLRLVKTKLYKKVFGQIPIMECFKHEDMLVSFFLGVFFPTYTVIPDKLYAYRLGGETTAHEMMNLQKWNRLCSASNVFTAMFLFLQQHSRNIQLEGMEESVRIKYNTAVRECILALNHVVPADIYEQAEHILYDAWGNDIIERVHDAMQKQDEEKKEGTA